MVACSRLCLRCALLYRHISQRLAVDHGTRRPELVKPAMRACHKPLGTGESLDSQLLGCNSKHRGSPAELEMSAPSWEALVCSSCQASQHRARSSSALPLSISTHGRDGDKPLVVSWSRLGNKNRSRHRGKESCLPAGIKSATLHRTHRHLALPREGQSRRTALSLCPQRCDQWS